MWRAIKISKCLHDGQEAKLTALPHRLTIIVCRIRQSNSNGKTKPQIWSH